MKKLTYKTLREIGYEGYILENAPERVLQFGEGNFLRAFVNYWFDLANERVGFNGKCVLVQPIPQGLADFINAQDGLYTLYLRGSEGGEVVNKKRIISSVSRCLNPYEEAGYSAMMDVAVSDDLEYIVSNTTEAGIVVDPSCKKEDKPASSFPGKLTQVLYERYKSGKPGVVILSCELIDHNGDELLRCVKEYIALWQLEDSFKNYVEKECTFCSTLVDRIVPGRVRDKDMLLEMERENNYTDALIDVGEVFGVWNIEGPEWLEDKLPFKRAGIGECIVVSDVTPYKMRKVRILNGAHTGTVLGAYLAGFNIVRDCMKNDAISGFMNKMLLDEILPLLPKECEGSREFAAAVKDRFNNPFIDHALLDISLNSTSKWKARNLVSLIDYVDRNGKVPTCLAMSLAAYIAFYSSEVLALADDGLHLKRPDGTEYIARDDRFVLEFYYEHRNDDSVSIVNAVMKNKAFWGMDLTEISGFEDVVTKSLNMIKEVGAEAAFASCI